MYHPSHGTLKKSSLPLLNWLSVGLKEAVEHQSFKRQVLEVNAQEGQLIDLAKRTRDSAFNFIQLLEKLRLPPANRTEANKKLAQESVYRALCHAVSRLDNACQIMMPLPSTAFSKKSGEEKDDESSRARFK